MNSYKIVELLGDGIATELSTSIHRVAKSLPCKLDFIQVDLSDEERIRRGDAVYDEAEKLMREHGVSMKYPTATTQDSPNRILRTRCQFAVIHRPVATIPGIENNFKRKIDIDIVRIATGGTYEDAGRRIGPDTAVSLRVISRGPCKHASRFAFKLAMVRGTSVVAASKYTIQQATDGLFDEVATGVSKDYPTLGFRSELFDALLANIVINPDQYGVIVLPNEYGDFLSDAACGLIGSIGLGDSASYAFDDEGNVTLAMFDPSGGTAPDIAGKNLCNPTAAFLALASLLRHIGELDASKALRDAIYSAIEEKCTTADIGGSLSTSEFTEEVCSRFEKLTAPA